MNLAAKRNFDVNYYEKEEKTWVIVSHLNDDPHDITLTIEMDMADFTITDSKIKFTRYPLNHCPKIEEDAKKLIGLKVDNMFIQNAMKIFMGPMGCPNIMTLLNISMPGIIYYYYPYQIKSKRMTDKDFYKMMRTELKNACLGHTLLDK